MSEQKEIEALATALTEKEIPLSFKQNYMLDEKRLDTAKRQFRNTGSLDKTESVRPIVERAWRSWRKSLSSPSLPAKNKKYMSLPERHGFAAAKPVLDFISSMFATYPHTLFLLDAHLNLVYQKTNSSDISGMVAPGEVFPINPETLSAHAAWRERTSVCFCGPEHIDERFQNILDITEPVEIDNQECQFFVSLLCSDEAAPANSFAIDCLIAMMRIASKSITDRHLLFKKNMQANLASDYFSAALSFANGGVISVDEMGKIDNITAKALKILDVASEIVIGSNINSMVSNDDQLIFLIRSGNAVNDRAITFNVSGRKIECAVSLRPITSGKGAVSGSLILIAPRDSLSNHNQFRGSSADITFDDLIGENESFLHAKQQAKLFSSTHSPILLIGELYTGKSTMAHAIHNELGGNRPFISIDCTRLNSEMADRQLFGFESANGSVAPGFLEMASGGTAFFERIDELPIKYQKALVSTFEWGFLSRIGGATPIPTDFKLLASTSIDFEKAHEDGFICSELYYYIANGCIKLPPLRHRQEDIIPLAVNCIRHFCTLNNLPIFSLSFEIKEFLLSYSWPGNIRQLQGSIRYACDVCHGKVLTISDLPESLRSTQTAENPSKAEIVSREVVSLKESEEAQIRRALRASNGNVAEASRILGISRTTFYKKMKKYDLANSKHS